MSQVMSYGSLQSSRSLPIYSGSPPTFIFAQNVALEGGIIVKSLDERSPSLLGLRTAPASTPDLLPPPPPAHQLVSPAEPLPVLTQDEALRWEAVTALQDPEKRAALRHVFIETFFALYWKAYRQELPELCACGEDGLRRWLDDAFDGTEAMVHESAERAHAHQLREDQYWPQIFVIVRPSLDAGDAARVGVRVDTGEVQMVRVLGFAVMLADSARDSGTVYAAQMAVLGPYQRQELGHRLNERMREFYRHPIRRCVMATRKINQVSLGFSKKLRFRMISKDECGLPQFLESYSEESYVFLCLDLLP